MRQFPKGEALADSRREVRIGFFSPSIRFSYPPRSAVSRIFTTLMIVALGFLAVNIVLGLRTGDYNGEFQGVRQPLEKLGGEIRELKQGRHRDLEAINQKKEQRDELLAEIKPYQDKASLHIMFGIVTALVNMLVCSISITYFVGSSHWMKEVTMAYSFDTEVVDQANRLKRRTFASALSAMLIIVVISALGGAANPGTLADGTAFWVTPHFLAAFIGTGLIAVSYFIQLSNISKNFHLIEQMTERAHAIRRERGLVE